MPPVAGSVAGRVGPVASPSMDRSFRPHGDVSVDSDTRNCVTEGTRSTAAIRSTVSPAAVTRTTVVPKESARGPTAAIPNGRNTRDPNQSYALTRESTSAGISRCMVVFHRAPNTDSAPPPKNDPMAIATVDTGYARAMRGNTQTKEISMPTNSGRLPATPGRRPTRWLPGGAPWR